MTIFVGDNDHGDSKPMDNESDIVVRLRSWTEGIYYDVDSELIEAADEIERLRKERDEARRMYCGVDNCTADEAMLLAKEQGWDCYKKEETQ